MINLKLFAGVALAFGLATNANAAITVFTDQASFLAATTNAGVDTFSDLVVAQYGVTMNRTAGTHSYTASAPNTFFPGSGGGNPFLSTNNLLDQVVFNGFGADVSAVGGSFFGSNINGGYTAASSITLSMIDADGLFTYTALNPTPGGFLGFVSTGGLSQFTVATVDSVWVSVDNFTLAGSLSAVPEPATWAMMIIGFGAVGSVVRTSRRRNVFAAA